MKHYFYDICEKCGKEQFLQKPEDVCNSCGIHIEFTCQLDGICTCENPGISCESGKLSSFPNGCRWSENYKGIK